MMHGTRPRGGMLALLILVLVTASSGSTSTGLTEVDPLAPGVEAACSMRVDVDAPGVPMRDLLEALSGASGIKLSSVDSEAGIWIFARASNRPLYEVLRSLARLRGGEWQVVPARDDRLTLRLSARRDVATARENQRSELIRRSVRRAEAGLAAAEPDEAPSPNPWHRPLLGLGRLLDESVWLRVQQERVVMLPPAGPRSDLPASAAPCFDELLAVARATQQELRREAPHLRDRLATPDGATVASMRACVGVSTIEKVRTLLGVTLPWSGSAQTVLAEEAPQQAEPTLAGAADAQMQLLTRLPVQPAQPMATPPEPQRPQRAVARRQEIAAGLRRISKEYRVAIYAEWIPGAGDRLWPRSFPTTGSQNRLMDVIRSLTAGPEQPAWGEWELRDESLSLRARDHIWLEERALSIGLLDRLRQASLSGRLDRATIDQLCRLRPAQIESIGQGFHQYWCWRETVGFAEGLSLASRGRLASGELTWGSLTPAEKAFCVSRGTAIGTDRYAYRARLGVGNVVDGLHLSVSLLEPRSLGAAFTITLRGEREGKLAWPVLEVKGPE